MAAPSPVESLTAEHVERIAMVDPVVARAAAPAPGRGELIEVEGGVGVLQMIDTDPDSPAATWTELRRHQLSQIRLGADEPAAAMGRLLAAWGDRLEDATNPGHGESAATLSWPSRDIEVVAVLRAGGLSPVSVVAARTSRPVFTPPPSDGAAVRPIESRDADAVVELQLVLARWDACFGAAHVRAATPDRMRERVAEILASTRPRGWVVEIAGEVVAACDVDWPEEAGWISPVVAADPSTVAYIASVAVAPGQRSRGVGSLLMSRVHDELIAGGVELPILHYAQLNPLSAPFWHRAGYRPVLTRWRAQPPTLLRPR